MHCICQENKVSPRYKCVVESQAKSFSRINVSELSGEHPPLAVSVGFPLYLHAPVRTYVIPCPVPSSNMCKHYNLYKHNNSNFLFVVPWNEPTGAIRSGMSLSISNKLLKTFQETLLFFFLLYISPTTF